MKTNQPEQQHPFGQGLMPQEEMLAVGKLNRRLVIGIPREGDPCESRIPLTPEAVEMLVSQGHEIVIEREAGKQANYTDQSYAERGATIVETPQEVFKSQILLKVSPLVPAEIELLADSQVIISSLHLKSSTGGYIRSLMPKRVTAIAFESIRDEDGALPVVKALSSIAGSTSVLVAAEYLSNVNRGKGIMLGGISGITPTEVVILGAGTVGEFAARAAIGLGASVKIVDSSVKRLMELQNTLGQRLYTSVFHPQVIKRMLKSADVVIGSLSPEEFNGKAIITEELVKVMKKGSVIIDLSIDKGGCFETSQVRSHSDPAFERHGVIHYCVPNITARVARTASIALSNVFAPLLLEIGDTGCIKQHLKEKQGLRSGVYVYNGILTNHYLGNLYNIPSRDINLLMAAF